MSIAENAQADYVLLQTQPKQLLVGQGALERMLRVASDSDAAMVYADHYDIVDGVRKDHPVGASAMTSTSVVCASSRRHSSTSLPRKQARTTISTQASMPSGSS